MLTSAKKKPNEKRDEYVLGTDAAETERLGLQHRLWSASAHALWEQAGIQPGLTVLDLGCGPGHATLDLAQIVGPKGHVIGVDESATFLKQLADQATARRLTNISRVLGDVQDLPAALPGEVATVDVAYARWVFCFLKKPEDVVKGLAKLVKPGGKVAVQDYFNYEYAFTLAPRSLAFEIVISAIGKSWRDAGGNPDIMGNLPGLFVKHGFRVETLSVSQRIARPGHPLWFWPQSFWDSYLPRLVSNGFLSSSQRSDFETVWQEASKNSAAFCVVPPVFDLIAVREK
jgi:SAM-dependent methyltransferase